HRGRFRLRAGPLPRSRDPTPDRDRTSRQHPLPATAQSARSAARPTGHPTQAGHSFDERSSPEAEPGAHREADPAQPQAKTRSTPNPPEPPSLTSTTTTPPSTSLRAVNRHPAHGSGGWVIHGET